MKWYEVTLYGNDGFVSAQHVQAPSLGGAITVAELNVNGLTIEVIERAEVTLLEGQPDEVFRTVLELHRILR